MDDFIFVKLKNETDVQKFSTTKTLLEISKQYNHKNPILLAKVNNKLQELNKTLTEDCVLEFLDITDANGFRVFQRTLTLMVIYAIKSILGKKTKIVIEHSINKNYYCEIIAPNIIITENLVTQIEQKVKEIINADISIEKLSLSVEKAEKICEEFALYDKIEMLQFRRASTVNFYKLDWFYDYFYGQLAPSTSVITNFKLIKQWDGLVIQFPDFSNPQILSEFQPFEKIAKVFKESSDWAKILGIETVGTLNKFICKGEISNIVRINEALHEKKLALIADMIYGAKKRIVLIAGPSSSGKTTFAHRLTVQLKVNGLNPKIISIDDYFKDQQFTPSMAMDEEYDFESIDAVDVFKLNSDIEHLLAGETVNIPHFNFATGKREDRQKYLTITDKDVLVIEGIHGLNPLICNNILKELKFKIFISALTQLNVDDHNRIPTTDTRLLRRIVRDHLFRKLDASATIRMWPQVTKGERNYIFPFQEDADAIFNSALVYELCVLKQFVEPILFNINKTEPEYLEASKLVKFLDSFLGVSSEIVPKNSIIREFIGGSVF